MKKELVSKIQTMLTKLNNKKTTELKDGQNISTDTLPKKIYG